MPCCVVSGLALLWAASNANAQAASAFGIRFEKAAYSISKASQIQANIIVDPVPAERLLTYGLMAQVESSSGVVGVVSLSPTNDYNFNGPEGKGAVRKNGIGESSIRGTSDFFAPAPPIMQDGILAKVFIQPLPVGTYTLSLLPVQTLGANEQIFVTGGLQVSDSVITFGSATLTVFEVAAAVAGTGTPSRNARTGLFSHSVTLSNTTSPERTLTKIRIWVDNLALGVSVANATGTLNGRYFIDYAKQLAAGTSVTLQVLFRSANQRAVINPVYSIEELETPPPLAVSSFSALPPPIELEKSIKPAMKVQAGAPALEFSTLNGVTYTIQYSSDLTHWQDAQPTISGTGATARWTDTGPPRTETAPSTAAARFYRVVATPAP